MACGARRRRSAPTGWVRRGRPRHRRGNRRPNRQIRVSNAMQNSFFHSRLGRLRLPARGARFGGSVGGPTVSRMGRVALHDTWLHPAGAVSVTSGPAQASSTAVDVIIRGVGSHGSRPQEESKIQLSCRQSSSCCFRRSSAAGRSARSACRHGWVRVFEVSPWFQSRPPSPGLRASCRSW